MNQIKPAPHRFAPLTEQTAFEKTQAPEFVLITGKPKKFRNKRVFDFVFSLLVILLLLSWLLPILALMILVSSRGPVFFIQKRVGAYGRVIRCIKLRTMVVNEYAHSQQALKDDPRITSFGKFLRLSCLDELPQFFNVLMGDMSIVGPRPHMLTDCSEFSAVVKDYHHRNFVKPGITGIAQIKGYRGKTDNIFDVVHRYKWDMFYVNNCSLGLDVRIIRQTIISTVSAIRTTLMGSKKTEPVSYRLKPSEYLN
jgi:putative colanic acid biosynthesis UDP-glucose lipid carrier transferase